EPAPEIVEIEEEEDLDELEGVEDLEVIEEEILVEEEVIEEDVTAEEPVAAAPSSESRSVPPDVQREAQIARLLTECDVFMRSGLKQKVMERRPAVLGVEPAHVEARERLKDLYLAQGQVAQAIGELMTLADLLAEEESAAAILYLREVVALDPAHPDANARLGAMGASVAPPGVVAADDDVLFLDEGAPVDEPDVLVTDETEGAAYVESDVAPVTAAPSLEGMADEPPTGSQARPAIPSPSGGSGLKVPRPMDLLAPMSPEEFEEVPLRPSSPGQLAADVARRSIAPG